MRSRRCNHSNNGAEYLWLELYFVNVYVVTTGSGEDLILVLGWGSDVVMGSSHRTSEEQQKKATITADSSACHFLQGSITSWVISQITY